MKNEFHDHLDKCERCRNEPFNLCREGSLLLKQTATRIMGEVKKKNA